MLVTAETGLLLAADSFRVKGINSTAKVRGFEMHLARFDATATAACSGFVSASWRADTLLPFLSEVRTRIAGHGDGFPRLELWLDDYKQPRLALALRPLPVLTHSIHMRSTVTTLTHAERKGPNIERLGMLNRLLGAEALVLDADRNVQEGATTSVLWWSANTLYSVSSVHRVDSITEKLAVGIARKFGHPVETRSITDAELVTKECWAVNALHGIRPIVTLDEVHLPTPNSERLKLFQAALDDTWQQVDSVSVVS